MVHEALAQPSIAAAKRRPLGFSRDRVRASEFDSRIVEPCAAFRCSSGSRIVLVPRRDDDAASGLRRRPSTLSTSRPRFGTRSAFRCRGPRSKAWHRVVRGQRSWSSRRPCRYPGAPQDARKSAIAATIEELERCGVPDERQTILVAGGLGRRFAQRDLERLLPPGGTRVPRPSRGARRGRRGAGRSRASESHPSGSRRDRPRADRHGGRRPCYTEASERSSRRAMRRRYGKQPRPTRCSKRPAHRPGVSGSSPRLPAARTALMGVSLVLDLPRLTGTFRGYPDDAAVVARVARSPLRAAFSVLPDAPPAGHSRKPGPPVAGDRRLRDRRPSRTRRLCCVGSLCAVLDSSSPWMPSSSACRGSGRTCRGSRPIPSRSPRSRSASRSA